MSAMSGKNDHDRFRPARFELTERYQITEAMATSATSFLHSLSPIVYGHPSCRLATRAPKLPFTLRQMQRLSHPD